METDSRLLELAQNYHSYSCREQAMGLLQAGTIALMVIGTGVAGEYLYNEKNKEAVAGGLGVVSLAALGMYATRRGEDYATKVRDIESKLRTLDGKVSEKRDPLSLPILTKEDIERKKHLVSMHRF